MTSENSEYTNVHIYVSKYIPIFYLFTFIFAYPLSMTTDNFCFYLQNRLIQTSQTGGQQYSATSPFSIPCMYTYILHFHELYINTYIFTQFTNTHIFLSMNINILLFLYILHTYIFLIVWR